MSKELRQILKEQARASGLATHNNVGIRSEAVKTVIDDYQRLRSPEARMVFARHWIAVTCREMNVTWVALYDLLRLVKDNKLYAVEEKLPNSQVGQTYETFKDFFEDVVRKPFQVWSELETTYQFVVENAPGLLERPFQEVKKVVARATKQGERTDLNGLTEVQQHILEEAEKGGTQAEIARKVGVTQPYVSMTLDNQNITNFDNLSKLVINQEGRTKQNNVGIVTQRKLDYLARSRPDLLQQVQTGQLSAHRAYKIAKDIKEPTPLDHLKKWWDKATNEEKVYFLDWIEPIL